MRGLDRHADPLAICDPGQQRQLPFADIGCTRRLDAQSAPIGQTMEHGEAANGAWLRVAGPVATQHGQHPALDAGTAMQGQCRPIHSARASVSDRIAPCH